MNDQQFEELLYHSGLVADGSWNELDDYDRNAIRLLAHLTVLRCIDVVAKRCVGDHNREDEEVQRCVSDLRQHFGVGE